MVGRQTPVLALIVPLILVGMVDGMRGVRQAWPAAIVGGFVFALAQFATLELHLRRAHRHRRLAARHRRHRRPAPGVAAQRADPRRALRPRARRRGRRRRRRRARARGAAQERRPPRHQGRDPRRLRAVPDHHRGLLDRADRADQDVPRGPRDGVRLARPERDEPGRRGGLGHDVQVQLGERRRHAAAGLRRDHDARPARQARPRAARSTARRWTSSSSRRSRSPPCSRWPT